MKGSSMLPDVSRKHYYLVEKKKTRDVCCIAEGFVHGIFNKYPAKLRGISHDS